MAQVDSTARRLELKLVYWGPSRGGKTTSVRSLHGACDEKSRGGLSSVETEDERTYFFDYAPIDLPRYKGFAIRVNCYTVPGQEEYVETRRRILRGADGVIFVADSSPGRREANAVSWKQLDVALRGVEGSGQPLPLLLAANKQDVTGAVPRDEVARRLAEASPTRAFVELVETVAISGKGVVRCFRSALVAAVDHVLHPRGASASPEERGAFLAALETHFKGSTDGVPLAELPGRRAAVAPSVGSGVPGAAAPEPEGSRVEAELETSRWLAVRDLDVKEHKRERALSQLLLDLGHLCASATEMDALARTVLSTLAMNLDAVTGWIGIPGPDGVERVYDPMGPVKDGAAVAEIAHVLGVGVPDGQLAPVGPATSTGFPGGAAGGEGLYLSFATGGGRRGWMILIGPPLSGLPEDGEAVVAPAGAFLGLTIARLLALDQLRRTNALLESRVEERTLELTREKESLEARVRERTKELEAAKRTALDAERRLLDLERTEGVHRLAAGLAHELNNPVGALIANLQFLRETIDDEGVSPESVIDLRAALDDAQRDAERVATSIRTLFGEAASSRRAAIRTPLSAAAREGIRFFAEAAPDVRRPRLVERGVVWVGVAPAECARWVFRLLTAMASRRETAVTVLVERSDDGPRLVIDADAPMPTGSSQAVEAVASEVTRAGGRIESRTSTSRASIRLVLPHALGEVRSAQAAGRVA